MGTRADFYIGTGPKAEWLGSVAWDGYEWGENRKHPLMKAKTEKAFRAAVALIATQRDDFTCPEKGWPWPWDDSNTSDCAYSFKKGKVKFYHSPESEKAGWPDMRAKKNVTLGSRSGLLVFRVGG